MNPELAVSPWAGHRLFAYDLLAFQRPKLVVELGTHLGCSFFAFLQAAKDLGIDSDFRAVDTWRGDEHAGFYDDDVFATVERTVRESFGGQRLRLLRKTFDEALADVPDGTVELLHIDGLHTYDAVRHDFETWLPKLAPDGIVLFHDVAPSTGYGSAKYWAELREKHPHFEFLEHSWGLGILFPRGERWRTKIEQAAPGGWQELYRYRSEADLLAIKLRAAEKMLVERWDLLTKGEAIVKDRDATIASIEKVVDARWTEMQKMDRVIAEQHGELARARAELARSADIGRNVLLRVGPEVALRAISKSDRGPFADLAFSLYAFVQRLHRVAQSEGVTDLFFLSREGFHLKTLFELHAASRVGESRVRCHYLEASRKSTFLPSLGPLADESFEVLFRQYRRMSLNDFLRSLALDDRADELHKAMGSSTEAFAKVEDDLPTSSIFGDLRRCARFAELYDRERKTRSDALAAYLGSFLGGSTPERLCLVDVGWKGSIQDNLHRWMATRSSTAETIGYYIGLISPGSMTERNRKQGLLFSNQGAVSPGFADFNENRSLFEVLLPATHGAPRSYAFDGEGKPVVEREPFVEEALLSERVAPVAAAIEERFREIDFVLERAPLGDDALLELVCELHRRMVLEPTAAEIEWMLNVTHSENFGVFGESHFEPGGRGGSLLDRARFTREVVFQRNGVDLGFWPYLTLKRRALVGTSTLYRQLRRWRGANSR